MCIIVVKGKGIKLPDETTLMECFDSNPDGAGFVYHDGQKTVMRKGLMEYDTFRKALSEIKDIDNKNLIMHFRITTHGLTDGPTTHPFPVTNNIKLLREEKLEKGWFMAHNGILSNYTYNSKLSDTQNFVKDFVYPMYNMSNKLVRDEAIYNIFDRNISTNKLAFMAPNGEIITIGDFEKDEGVLYSNSTYQTYYSRYRSKIDPYYSRYYDDNTRAKNYKKRTKLKQVKKTYSTKRNFMTIPESKIEGKGLYILLDDKDLIYNIDNDIFTSMKVLNKGKFKYYAMLCPYHTHLWHERYYDITSKQQLFDIYNGDGKKIFEGVELCRHDKRRWYLDK